MLKYVVIMIALLFAYSADAAWRNEADFGQVNTDVISALESNSVIVASPLICSSGITADITGTPTPASGQGAASTNTVTATDDGVDIFKVTVAFDDTVVPITWGNSGTNSIGSLKIYDFPKGQIQILGAVVSGFIVVPNSTNGGFAITDGGDFAFGTAAETAPGLDTATAVNIIPKTSHDPFSTATTNTAALAATATIDGRTTAVDLYYNMIVDADDLAAEAGATAKVNGSIDVYYINYGY